MLVYQRVIVSSNPTESLFVLRVLFSPRFSHGGESDGYCMIHQVVLNVEAAGHPKNRPEKSLQSPCLTREATMKAQYFPCRSWGFPGMFPMG